MNTTELIEIAVEHAIKQEVPEIDQVYYTFTSFDLQQFAQRIEQPHLQHNQANARLIAAAPELYAVLSELEESCEYWSEYEVPLGIAERIKSALQKARGEQ